MSYIDPDREAWEIFKSLPHDQPIQMLNLVKLKPKAEYPADHPVTPADVTRTVYEAMGIRDLEAFDSQRRPYNLLAEGKPIGELF